MALEPASDYVADVNAWISFFSGDKLKRILSRLAELNIRLHSSPELLKEFKKVYHDKSIRERNLLSLPLENYLEAMEATCYVHETESRYRLMMDYKDNYLVDLCADTGSVLISNDKGFDFFKRFKLPPLQVIKVSEFYEAIGM